MCNVLSTGPELLCWPMPIHPTLSLLLCLYMKLKLAQLPFCALLDKFLYLIRFMFISEKEEGTYHIFCLPVEFIWHGVSLFLEMWREHIDTSFSYEVLSYFKYYEKFSTWIFSPQFSKANFNHLFFFFPRKLIKFIWIPLNFNVRFHDFCNFLTFVTSHFT